MREERRRLDDPNESIISFCDLRCVSVLETFVGAIEPAEATILGDWQIATLGGVAALMEQNKSFRKSSSDAADRHRGEEMEKETIRAKCIMLEDKVDRLEHEKGTEIRRRHVLETEHRKHLELAEAEKGRLRVQSTNGDERVRSLQQRLDASATQARALQTEV